MSKDFDQAMRSIEVLTDDHDADYWREQVLLDEWIGDGAPDVDQWLSERPDKPRKAPHKRPARKAAAELPPSELRSQLTLTKSQAGKLLGGMSDDWIEKHVLPHVKTLPTSRSVLIDAADLQRWVAESTGRALG